MKNATNTCKLSVNINKVALLRNQRKGNLPDLLEFARKAEQYGAQGITVHPRPDERHIRYSDVPALKSVVTTELNVEGNPTEHFLKLIEEVRPEQCTLVPDPPGVLTSDQGWDISQNREFLAEVVQKLHDWGVRSSVFIDPNAEAVEAAFDLQADRVELYTGDYAKMWEKDPSVALQAHVACAEKALELGIGLNAGHDLNLHNLPDYYNAMKGLMEVSIGHALVADCLDYGLSSTIRMYRCCLL